MKTQKEETKKLGEGKGKKMNRKEAISKAGFIAISAATTMMLLSNPEHATGGSSSSAPAAPTTPSGDGGQWIRRTAP